MPIKKKRTKKTLAKKKIKKMRSAVVGFPFNSNAFAPRSIDSEMPDAQEVITQVRQKEDVFPKNESLPLDSLPKIKQARTAGEILKQARAKSGLSISDAARYLELPSKYIEALEQDEIKVFTARIYAEGVLHRYARYLKIADREVFDAFSSEWTKRQGKATLVKSPLHYSNLGIWVITPRRLALAGGFLAVVLVVSYFVFQISRLIEPPTLSIKSPQEAAVYLSEEILVEGEVSDPESSLTLNGKVLYSDEAGRFKEKIVLSQGVHVIEVDASNKFGKVARVVRNVSVDLPWASTTPGP